MTLCVDSEVTVLIFYKLLNHFSLVDLLWYLHRQLL